MERGTHAVAETPAGMFALCLSRRPRRPSIKLQIKAQNPSAKMNADFSCRSPSSSWVPPWRPLWPPAFPPPRRRWSARRVRLARPEEEWAEEAQPRLVRYRRGAVHPRPRPAGRCRARPEASLRARPVHPGDRCLDESASTQGRGSPRSRLRPPPRQHEASARKSGSIRRKCRPKKRGVLGPE